MNPEKHWGDRRAFFQDMGRGVAALALAGTASEAAEQGRSRTGVPAGARQESLPGPSRKNKNLLFFFTDENCPEAAAVTPTLSWLAAKMGLDFEAYVCVRPKTWAGKILAFSGHGHAEQFYYAANFYDKVLYCSLTQSPAVQFKREVMAFGGDIVSTRKPGQIVEFYRDLFSYFRLPFPAEAVVVPGRPEGENDLWIQPFCYPDICFREALGLSDRATSGVFKQLKAAGTKRATVLYCPDQTTRTMRSAGLAVEVADSVKEGDGYGTLTCRIADRWLDRAKGIAFGDPLCILKWAPSFLREGYLSLYEPVQWRPFVDTVAAYAKKTNNNLIYGTQTVKPFTDDVVTEFSRRGLVSSLVGPDARIGLTVQSRHRLPVDWLSEIRPPWDEEYDDRFLQEQAEKGGIPVCCLFYASDIGHLPTLPRILDLMLLEGAKCGLAFPSTWYDYQPELLEQFYVPVDMGGVYPNIEPLLVSAGTGVAAEAQGYLDARTLTDSIKQAREQIAGHVGPRLVPIGYYPFQDACPAYKHQTGQPQFAAVEASGVKYCITYLHENTAPQVVYRSDKLIAINQQTLHWHPRSVVKTATVRIKEWEAKITQTGRAGWIVFGFDSPFYGLAPGYLRFMEGVLGAMEYAIGGGKSKKLFLAKPHEVARYAEILKKSGVV